MWRVHKSAGRPWPTLDDDEVIDYLVAEAIATKVAQEEIKQRKDAELSNWKKDKTDLKAAIPQ